MIINPETATALRVKRAKLGLTKRDTAKIIGVSIVTYSRLEAGGWKAQREIYQKVVDWLVKDYE